MNIMSKRARGSVVDSGSPKRKPPKRYCSFTSAWKKEEFKVDIGCGSLKVFSGAVLSGTDGDDHAFCTLCRVKFSVRHGGANDVRKHFASTKHTSAVSSKQTTRSLSHFGFGNSAAAVSARDRAEELNLKVQRAEALFVHFIAEHNLPFRTGDHFTKLVKKMFPDSEIARQFQCSRTKTSVITNYGNGKWVHDQLVASLTDSSQPVFFSLLVDESNDRGVEAKDLVVLVRFFDPTVMRAVTRFLDLQTANHGTAAAIFEKIDWTLTSRGIKYENLICFNSDTCNTMKGVRNGVVRYLRDKQPNLTDFGCICHLENLAIKAAIKVLPVNVDTLLVDINTHFYLSIKRKEEFKTFCEFVNVTYKQILSHVETRWLSLLRVVSRVLELWPALVSYFTSHPESEKRGRVKSIKERLCDEVKLYLLFLNFLLPTANAFNVAFQATSYTTIHLLHPEMRKLTKRILRYFVSPEHIDVGDVTATKYEDCENQVSDDDLEVGDATRTLALELTENGMEHVVSSFFDHVRLFYAAFVTTLIKKFPFKSSLLSDLRVLNPTERLEFQDFPNAVIRLTKLFPQLQLEGEKLDQLKTEAYDLQMADPEDLPDTNDVDDFWAKLHLIKSPGSTESTYATLLVLVRALLALPASNADSERCFSMVRKIDSEDRSHLERSTVASLLTLKIDVDESCFNYEPPEEMLKVNKTAVRLYNEAHGSYNNN